jgi:hypothetical protein
MDIAAIGLVSLALPFFGLLVMGSISAMYRRPAPIPVR